jgi:hypothetical protein
MKDTGYSIMKRVTARLLASNGGVGRLAPVAWSGVHGGEEPVMLFRQLESFLAPYRERHFAWPAEAAYVSQPALSTAGRKQISDVLVCGAESEDVMRTGQHQGGS